MRCVACDCNLSNYESTRKIINRDSGTISYPDLCNKCFNSTDLASFASIIERHDLETDSLDENLEIPMEE